MMARICPHKSRHSLRKVRISCVWYHAAVVHSDHSNWSKGDGEGKMVDRLVISKQTRFRKRFELKEHRRISSVVILRQMKSKSVAKCNEYLSRSLVYSQAALQALFALCDTACELEGYCRAQRLLVCRVAYAVPVNTVDKSRLNSRQKVSEGSGECHYFLLFVSFGKYRNKKEADGHKYY